jgi:glycosyltransferase involved in cell wall biosynthesis
MNILQIAPKVPFPLLDGGSLGVFNITKHLSERGHKITFLTFSMNEIDANSEFRKYCNLIIVKKDTSNKVFGLLMSYFSKIPYTHYKYISNEFIEVIRKELSKKKYDIVHIDHLHMSYYVDFIKSNFSIPVVLREHNYETLIWERLCKSEEKLIKGIIYRTQYKKMQGHEITECKKFDFCITVTNEDAEKIIQKDSSINVEVIPAGVDLKYFFKSDVESIKERTILLLGALDWFPNIDACKWFYYNIFPLLKKKYPDVVLTVIGKNPPEEILNIKDSSVNMLGMVGDIRPYLRSSNVCVVPLRIGGGMRIKILEMFAAGKAIVSTSIGAEGIEVNNEEHLLIGNDEISIVNAISKIFDDKNFMKHISENGYNLVCEKYSWSKIAEKFEQFYISVIDRYHAK